MWQPTHVKVTVKQAKNVLTKGKNGTNDSFVVIGIGKTKFQTSVKEKSGSNVEWNEECELEIPSQGNKAGVQLTVYHHNNLGLDEFLGQCSLPLTDFDVYEKPKFRWYRLRGKPEKDKKKGEKERGELEVMVNFTVKSESILDVNKKEKHKTSLSSLKHLGGSLLSIGGKEKQGLKNFAKSVSSRMDKIAKPKKNKKSNNADYSSPFSNDMFASRQHFGEADPGVISDDDDDFRFEDDIKVNTRTSSPMSTMSRGSSLMHDQVLDTDGEIGTYDDGDPDFALNFGNSPPKPPRIIDETKEAFSPHNTLYPVHSRKITSFSDPKPSATVLSSTPEMSSTIIEEESSDKEENLTFHVHRSSTSRLYKSDASSPKFDDMESPKKIKKGMDSKIYHETSSASYRDPGLPSELNVSTKETPNSDPLRYDDSKSQARSYINKVDLSARDEETVQNASQKDVTKKGNIVENKDDRDSAISLGNDDSVALSDKQMYISSNESLSTNSKSDSRSSASKEFVKSPSEVDVLRRKDQDKGRRQRHVVSAADCLPDWQNNSDIVRSGSLNEKRSSVNDKRTIDTVSPAISQPSVVDEWERKLYGRIGITGSTENMSRSESRSSINTSRESSVHDIRKEDSFTRLPGVKALTLEKKPESDSEGKKQKKKIKPATAFKNRFFNSSKFDEKVSQEEGRFVEGGNDRVPSGVLGKQSRLPQEILDKFSGKTREDLIERILSLESNMARQAKHSSELEDYIDNLLLRVMEATPHILQAPIETKKSAKFSFGR